MMLAYILLSAFLLNDVFWDVMGVICFSLIFGCFLITTDKVDDVMDDFVDRNNLDPKSSLIFFLSALLWFVSVPFFFISKHIYVKKEQKRFKKAYEGLIERRVQFKTNNPFQVKDGEYTIKEIHSQGTRALLLANEVCKYGFLLYSDSTDSERVLNLYEEGKLTMECATWVNWDEYYDYSNPKKYMDAQEYLMNHTVGGDEKIVVIYKVEISLID